LAWYASVLLINSSREWTERGLSLFAARRKHDTGSQVQPHSHVIQFNQCCSHFNPPSSTALTTLSVVRLLQQPEALSDHSHCLLTDVQLTKDDVCVIYHDFLVAETGSDVAMHTLTYDQASLLSYACRYFCLLTSSYSSWPFATLNLRQSRPTQQLERCPGENQTVLACFLVHAGGRSARQRIAQRKR
jgi:hypothetical protein